MKKFMSHFIIVLIICAQIGSSVTVFGEESGQSPKLEQSNGNSEKTDTVETTASKPMSDSEEKQNTKLEQPNVSSREIDNSKEEYVTEPIIEDIANNGELESSTIEVYAGEPLVIPDLIVRKAINTALKHINDWETYMPTIDEIAGIKGIFYLKPTQSESVVNSLEGMQYLTGITQLYATDIKFSDSNELNKLSSLKQLLYLSMGNTDIENIDFIKGLDNLTGLVLPDNKIKDVSPSYDYYNSGNRKQYNFLTQNVDENIDVNYAETITIPPMKLTGVNGNQVAFQSFVNNPNNNFSYSNGEFIGKNLLPGKNYQLSYRFIDNSINHAGAFSGVATINITVIAPDAAPVIVKYEDENGNESAPSEVLNGKVGNPYTSVAKSINYWTLKETPANANGTFTDQPQTVTYVYERIEAAPVTVKYVDEEGNELATSETLNGKIGLPYQSTAKSITGWTLKETPANASGIFMDQPQAVTYVYERTEAAPITVKYVDEEDNELATSEILNGKVGLPYQSTAKSITGWTLKETPANASGTFTDQPQTVTYVYERTEAASVTVKYVDEEGNELATSETLNGKIGLPYQSTVKSIAGWTLKETPANANGTLTDEVQTVTYVYKKAKSNHPIVPPNNIDKGDNVSSSKLIGNRSNSSLPQAGEQQTSKIWGILGMLLFGSSVVVIDRRRKYQK